MAETRRLEDSAGILVVFALLILGALATPASAQYFGRNKVQYRTIDFKVLKTEHFDIYYYPSEEAGVQIAARMAERWNARLTKLLRHQLRGRQPLILYGSHVDFEQTNVIGGDLNEGTGGVTEPVKRRIVLPLAGPLADTDHVIGHELVHAFQFDITTPPDSAPGRTGAEQLPLWFIEGMAEYLSIGPVDPNTAMWLRDATRREKLPAIKDLNDPKYFPYRWGQAFWAYVGGRWGDDVIAPILAAAPEKGVDQAFKDVLGVDSKQLSKDWQDSLLKTYTPVLTATAPVEPGRVLIAGEHAGADLNVGPSISPDGQRVAFLSSRGLLSVDLYLADTKTGQVIRKLISTASNPHYSSIQFIYSAGAWDSASRHLAVATVTGGRAALAVFDTENGDVSREIKVPGVDEIFNPTWAPEGNAIAFTGMHHGLTDLFILDLDTETLRQMTDDSYADLQPAWSPDGRQIAFSTDRFSTNLGTLSYGPYQLAVMDISTKNIRPVNTAFAGKQINPQWSPDGNSLYFISDREGISNLYRTPVAAPSDTRQITAVVTGVSGITALSPAASVASRSGEVTYTVYDDGGYAIRLLDSGPAGMDPRSLSVNAAQLPPGDRKPSQVAQLLASPADGLPQPQDYPVEPYRPKFGLTGVAQPVVGVGVSRYGTSLGGGIALTFGDTLGNHVLATAVQVNSAIGRSTDLKDVGAQVGYFNLTHRWNWGLIGGQVPYQSGGYQSTLGQLPNGDVVQTDSLYLFRQTERSVSGLVSYPFNRSSRVDFQGGVTSISFDQTVTSTTYSIYTGAVYDQSTQTTPIGQTLNLTSGSAAYVFDTSVFGATSPVQGQRSRIEYSPTFGTLNFSGVLADYRRYFMPAPFYTIAVRGMHFGRYGSDAEDSRLFPLDIGYPWLVRGYDIGSINASECVPDATSSCPVIDRVLGSRMFVGNVELRFPLLRPFGVSSNVYGPVPVEVAFFADGGVAWNSGQKPAFLGGSRDGVSSAGVAFRVNFFGFAVGEFDFTRAFQRPDQGWIFGFNLLPGW